MRDTSSIVVVKTPWRDAEVLFGPATWSRCEVFARAYVNERGHYVTGQPHILRDTPRARRCWLRRMGMKRFVPAIHHLGHTTELGLRPA